MRKLILGILQLAVVLTSCKNSTIVNTKDNSIIIDSVKQLPPLPIQFSLKDLKKFSKSKHGFVQQNGEIDKYYGRLELINDSKDKFIFWCGLGSCGDGLDVELIQNSIEESTFDIFIKRGERYYGNSTSVDRKIGSLVMISNNEVKGNIKYCSNAENCCIDKEFILRKIEQEIEDISNYDNSTQVTLKLEELTSIPQYAKKETSDCINCCLRTGTFGQDDADELIGMFVKKGLLVKINGNQIILKLKSSRKGRGEFSGYQIDRYEHEGIVFDLTTMTTNATGFRDGTLEVYNNNKLVQKMDINEVQCY